jgi:hypothetical protein
MQAQTTRQEQCCTRFSTMSDRWLAPCGLAIGIKKWQTAPLHNLAFGPTNHVVETRPRRTSGLAQGGDRRLDHVPKDSGSKSVTSIPG